MQCIYLVVEECRAQVTTTEDMEYYKPKAEEREKLCQSGEFRSCPRLQAFENYMRLSGVGESESKEERN